MLTPPWSTFKKSFTKCQFDKIDIFQYVLYIHKQGNNCRWYSNIYWHLVLLFKYWAYFSKILCLHEYHSILVSFFSKNLHNINFFKMFYHVFSTKINPRGASIHRINDLFPLKPPLEIKREDLKTIPKEDQTKYE